MNNFYLSDFANSLRAKQAKPIISQQIKSKTIKLTSLIIALIFNLQVIQAQYSLNLSVDMRSQTASPNGVHVAGTFNNWSPESLPLEDNDQDGIYEISIPVGNETYEYKFLNGTTWDTEENVYGSCEVYTNRFVHVSSNVTVPTVCFGYCSEACSQTEEKLACVGNSITWGHGVTSLYEKTWPAQLQDMLGTGHYCENLGVSGRTLMKSGDNPWWNESQFSRTFNMQPDVIFIKLGTNDSKSYNWNGNAALFQNDCIALIDTFRTISPQPDLYLLTPAKAYSSAYGIDENIIQNEMIPILRQVAIDKGVHVIDIHTATSGMPQNFPDGVHPNDQGAATIAQKVFDLYTESKPTVSVNGSTLSVSYSAAVSYQWYLNGLPISGATQSSYTSSVAGDYQVAVKLSTANDDRLISAAVSLGGLSNDLPQISLTSPINNSTYAVGDNVVISALASDPDGSITKVEFFQGAVKLGEVLTSPFSMTWSNPGVGSYNISARVTDNLGATTSTPYTSITINNAPLSIPGKIEAEDWSTMLGLSTEACSEGGLNVGWVDPGDWADYDVNVTNTGNYTVSFRIAADGTSVRSLELQTGSSTATASFTATGGWQNWTTATTTINLSAGSQTLRVYFPMDSINFNWFELTEGASNAVPVANAGANQTLANGTTTTTLDGSGSSDSDNGPSALTYSWSQTSGPGASLSNSSAIAPTVSGLSSGNSYTFQLVVNDGAANSVASTVNINVESATFFSLHIEAEDFSDQSGIQTENCTEGGLNVGWTDAGDWINYYNLTIPNSGAYIITYRVASSGNQGTFNFESDNGNTNHGTVNINASGSSGWQDWKTISHTVTLQAGTRNYGIGITNGGFNFNWFEITSVSGARIGSPIQINTQEDINIEYYPNPALNQLTISGISKQYNQVTVYSLDGRKQLVKDINNIHLLKLDISSFERGLFFIRLDGNGVSPYSFRFMKQ